MTLSDIDAVLEVTRFVLIIEGPTVTVYCCCRSKSKSPFLFTQSSMKLAKKNHPELELQKY